MPSTPTDGRRQDRIRFRPPQYPSYGRSSDRIWNMRGNWTIDYPKADRQFVQGVRRLTRIHTRSVEQVVNLEDDEIYNWPWIYVVEPGHWELTDAQAQKTARLPAARRLPDDRRFPRNLRMGYLHAEHEKGVPGSRPSSTSRIKTQSSTSYTIWTTVFRFPAWSHSEPAGLTNTMA